MYVYPSLPASATPAGAMRGAVLAGALWPVPGAGGGPALPCLARRGGRFPLSEPAGF